MAFKQPRIPEYRESEGTSKYLKSLVLFLKDFCMESWKATMTMQKNGSGMYAFHIDERGHLICTYDTSSPPPLHIDENGHLIYTLGE